MHTIPTLGKEWRVSLDFKPTDYSNTTFTTLLHLIVGKDGGSYPVTAIFFDPEIGIFFDAEVNGGIRESTLTDRPPLGVWTSLEISQEKVGGKFVYRIVIGGEEFHSVENTQPEEFEDVKVYASSPWNPPQPGSIKALLVQTKLGQFYIPLLTVH